jgi:vancomycin resistance protein YoaR
MLELNNDSEKVRGNFFSKNKLLVIGSIVLSIFLISLIGAGIAAGLYQKKYTDVAYPGVYVGFVDVSGMTENQIASLLSSYEESINKGELTVKADGKSFALSPIITSASNSDFAKPIIDFNFENIPSQALRVGRDGNFFESLITPLRLRILPRNISIDYLIDETEIKNILSLNFGELEKPAKNASLEIRNNKLQITNEETGMIFDYEKAIETLHQRIETLKTDTISLNLETVSPTITKSEAQIILNNKQNTLNSLEKITITFEEKTWEISPEDIRSWLDFQYDNNELTLGISKEKAELFINKLTEEINVPAKEPKFELNDAGRVTEFQSSQDGKELNVDATLGLINQAINNKNTEPINAIVDITVAQVANGDLNNLGIKELLGRGVSNFAGSPANRRHNIATGASKVHGVLIKPGETFSMIDSLGEIDGDAGYLRELVIKGNRTVPEYGGGLCQVSSTTFRAALNAGLPIVERRNHSFRVRYYEPAGLDATIYDPAPDFKFLNDTGHHILFITKIEGDNLIFEFYGTKDGRTAVMEPNPPRIYNVTSPGPARYIETDELAPGQKKKVESAYAGATTYFKYIINYPDGEVYEKEFYSTYVPWSEVWLVGKEEAPEEPVTSEPNETSTQTDQNQTIPPTTETTESDSLN